MKTYFVFIEERTATYYIARIPLHPAKGEVASFGEKWKWNLEINLQFHFKIKNPPTLLSGQFSPVTAAKGIMKKYHSW